MKINILGDICTSHICDDVEIRFEHLLNEDNINIANLECVLPANHALYPTKKTGCNLMGAAKTMHFLKGLGIKVVTLANNHVGDYGEDGVKNTIELLDEANILHVGADCNIDAAYNPLCIQQEDGLSVSIISVCENEFGVASENSAGVAGFDYDKILKLIRKEKVNNAHVIVIFHGGMEYCPFPSPYAIKRYRALIDSGASLVIGGHPHCPQGYEEYGGGVIFYSLANFYFPENCNSVPFMWNKGYYVSVNLTQSDFLYEIVPYYFTLDGNKICEMFSDERTKFISYLHKISEMIKNKKELEDFYNAWTVFRGYVYARNIEEYEDDVFELQNIMRCESHRELIFNWYKLLSDFNYDTLMILYEEKWNQIQDLMLYGTNRQLFELSYIRKDYGKIIKNKDELIRYIKLGNVSLYGAGNVAKGIINLLTEEDRNLINKVYVTEEKDIGSFEGIEKKQFSVSKTESNELIIIATTWKIAEEIIKKNKVELKDNYRVLSNMLVKQVLDR